MLKSILWLQSYSFRLSSSFQPEFFPSCVDFIKDSDHPWAWFVVVKKMGKIIISGVSLSAIRSYNNYLYGKIYVYVPLDVQ